MGGSDSRPRNERGLWPYLVPGAFALLTAIGIACYLGSGDFTIETICHLWGSKSRRELNNSKDIVRIRYYLSEVASHNLETPPEQNVDITKGLPAIFVPAVLTRYAEWKGPMPPNVLGGIDQFGTPFIFLVRPAGESDLLREYEITIRSAGGNRRDEGGLGDDVEQTMYLPVRKPSP